MMLLAGMREIYEVNVTRLHRLAIEGIWIVVGQVSAVLGSLVLVRVLTEHLDPAQYGELALGLTVAGLMNQVVMGGISAGIGRYYSIASEKNQLHSYLCDSRKLMLYATLTVAAFGLMLMAGLLWLGYSRWMGLAAAALVFSLLSGYNAALSGIQNAARQRAIVAFHGGLDAWLKILLVLGVMLWVGSYGTAVVIGYALSTLVIIFSQLFYLSRLIPGQKAVSKDHGVWIGQMWVYSWPMVAGGLFNWGYYASQRWALELFATTGEVGKFYALTQIAYTPISMAGAMVLSFLTPIVFARAGNATDHGRIRDTHLIIMRVAVVGLGLTLLIAVISLFTHEIVFQLMVASSYRGISLYMPHVILAAGILQVSQSLLLLVTIENQTRKILPLAIIGNSITAIMNLYFTRQWGINGLIISMVAGASLHLVWVISIVSANVSRLRRLETPEVC